MTDNEWQFDKPTAAKHNDSSGKSITVFTFNITNARAYNEMLTCTIEALNTPVFTPALISSYLLDLYAAFLRAHSSKFAKSYTPAQLIRITRHTLRASEQITGICDWTLLPKTIEVTGNSFNIIWIAQPEPKIELADNDDLEEIDVASMVSANVSDNDFLRLNSPEKLKDIERLKKANLRMKISKLRLERAMTKYLSKYGDLEEDLFSSSDEDGETDYESESD